MGWARGHVCRYVYVVHPAKGEVKGTVNYKGTVASVQIARLGAKIASHVEFACGDITRRNVMGCKVPVQL